MRILKTWMVGILSLQSGLLLAQTKTLTMQDAIQLGLQRNLNVVQADNNVQAAQSNVLAAYGGYLPTLSASANWSRTQIDQAAGIKVISGQPIPFDASFQVTNYYTTGLSLSYNLFDGFARGARLHQASSSALSTQDLSQRTKQSVVYQVESDYLNVLRNEQLVLVSEENLKRDQRQLERIEESNKVGALSIADVYRQQSQVAQDEYALISAQNDFDKAKADLMALIGLDVADNYSFADSTISPELSQAEVDSTMSKYGDFSSLIRRAIAVRPDYLSAEENLHAAESGITVAKSSYFPSAYISAGYGLSSSELQSISNNKNLNWGIGFRWTLFDGFQTNQAVQSAIAQQRNAEITYAQAQLGVNVDVKKAVLDLDAARKQYESAQRGLVSAREDQKIAEEKYNLGAGTLLDLLTANAAYTQAEANKVNAVYNYITSKLNLDYMLGEARY